MEESNDSQNVVSPRLATSATPENKPAKNANSGSLSKTY